MIIEVLKMEVKGFENLPPALKDTIRRKWKCTCDCNEVDKIEIHNTRTFDYYLICRHCGLVKKYEEGLFEAEEK